MGHPASDRLAEFFKVNEELIEQGLMTEDLASGQSFEDITVPTPWETHAEVCISAEINAIYTFSLDDPNPWYSGESPFGRTLAHPIALVQLGTRPLLRQFPVAVPDGESSLHAKMEVDYLAPAFVGETYVEEGRLAEKYIRRNRKYLVTEGRFLDPLGKVVLRYRHTRMVGRVNAT